MNRRSATIGLITLEVILTLLINNLGNAIVLPFSIKGNILLLLLLLGICLVALIYAEYAQEISATIGVITLGVISSLFINILGNAIVLPSSIKGTILLLLLLLGICLVALIYVKAARKKLIPWLPGLGKPYLIAVILGVFLSLVSILFMDLIPIVVGIDPSPTPLQALPCLVTSLIAGVTLSRNRAGLPASLLAGLLIGISGDTFIMVKYGPFLPYFPSYAWALITTDPVICVLLSWLAARTRIRTRGALPALEQNKRRRSPAVTIFLILLALIVPGGATFDIYHNVTSIHSGTIGNLSGVAWSGSQFVVVGGIGLERAKGFILTSPDGHTWTPQSSGLSDLPMLWGVAWSGSQFVAVGYGGTIVTSPDGRAWTPQSSGASSLLDGVVWSGSQFVVVGWGTTIVTSPDGSTWTPQSSGTSPYRFYDGVAWSGSQFVVVGDNGILTSSNGSTWTPPPSNTLQWLDGVVWSGSQFVAVGASGTILTSPDGSTWTPQSSGTSQWLHGVVWSGSQFVVVGESGTILTSPDGHTWTPQSSGTSQPLNKVAWSGSQFVAVGYGGVILTSPDGSTWT